MKHIEKIPFSFLVGILIIEIITIILLLENNPDSIISKILLAFITAIFAIGVWYVGFHLTKLKEYNKEKKELNELRIQFYYYLLSLHKGVVEQKKILIKDTQQLGEEYEIKNGNYAEFNIGTTLVSPHLALEIDKKDTFKILVLNSNNKDKHLDYFALYNAFDTLNDYLNQYKKFQDRHDEHYIKMIENLNKASKEFNNHIDSITENYNPSKPASPLISYVHNFVSTYRENNKGIVTSFSVMTDLILPIHDSCVSEFIGDKQSNKILQSCAYCIRENSSLLELKFDRIKTQMDWMKEFEKCDKAIRKIIISEYPNKT